MFLCVCNILQSFYRRILEPEVYKKGNTLIKDNLHQIWMKTFYFIPSSLPYSKDSCPRFFWHRRHLPQRTSRERVVVDGATLQWVRRMSLKIHHSLVPDGNKYTDSNLLLIVSRRVIGPLRTSGRIVDLILEYSLSLGRFVPVYRECVCATPIFSNDKIWRFKPPLKKMYVIYWQYHLNLSRLWFWVLIVIIKEKVRFS